MKRKGFWRKIVWVAALLLIGACSSSVTPGPAPEPEPGPEITVEVSPETAQVRINETQQFTATVTEVPAATGIKTISTTVTWSVNEVAGGNSTCGTITTEGLYTAPASVPEPATVTVKATSQEDTSKSDTATVTVEAEPQVFKISCLGDSLTEGYPYIGTANTYPARLQSRLDETYGSGRYQVINHGKSGYRADQVLADMQSLDWLAADQPSYVLLLVGGNDLAQETGGDPTKFNEVVNRTVGEVQDIVDLVVAHRNSDGSRPKIIVSATLPTRNSLMTTAVNMYNSSLASHLTGHDLWFTTNWSDFYNSSTGRAIDSLMSDDLHPNIEGYNIMSENWSEAVDRSGSSAGKEKSMKKSTRVGYAEVLDSLSANVYWLDKNNIFLGV